MQYQKPTLVQKQHLKMSPQLYQSIQLMALPLQDLKMRIQQEIEQNPAIEMVNNSSEVSWDELKSTKSEEPDYFENSSDPGYVSGGYDEEGADAKKNFMEGALSRPESLHEHLMWQLRLQPIHRAQFRVGELLIWNLDENGFHIEDPEKLVKEEDKKLLHETIHLIQQFDPVGVCTAHYRESLLVQAELSPEAPPHTEELIENHLDLIEKRGYEEAAKKTGIPPEEVKKSVDFIRTLTPYPGRIFSNEGTTYVTPDVVVRRVEGDFKLVLNDDEIPALEVNPYYLEMAESRENDAKNEARKFIKNKVNDARWFIRSISQRNSTLLNISRSIVEFQRKFFLYGPKHLAPLTLKDVAAEVGVHETTVSRIVNAKYIQTEWGIYPLKYFFSNSISGTGSSGSKYSKEAVKEIIKEIIEEQGDRDKRLSDQKISDILKKRGISIARRTVAKYRGELTIESSYYR
ncbi:MAG: RNA polymerase factor sigma-54 [Spirochaetaceae bacterium]